MAYGNKDVEGMMIGQALLFFGVPVVGLGGLVGIGVGGYFIGAAIGLAGFAAVGAGGGIILGGLVALGLAGLGVWGIVAGIMSAVEKHKQKKQKQQQEINDKAKLTLEGSTKQILQASPQVEQAKELPKNPEAVALLQNVSVEPAPEVNKPSFFSKIAGFFKRKTKDAAAPSSEISTPQPK